MDEFAKIAENTSRFFSLNSLSSLSPSIFPFSYSPLAFPNVFANSGIFFAPKIRTTAITIMKIHSCPAIKFAKPPCNHFLNYDLNVLSLRSLLSISPMPARYNPIIGPCNKPHCNTTSIWCNYCTKYHYDYNCISDVFSPKLCIHHS